MIRTLTRYLAKDLAKIAGLATVVITIMMTVLVIIEPLRERGLGGGQALKLFIYSMPVMFSLTLPVAALFAATLVYGRFSQDNELMASRASGLAAISLLRPAMWLGMIVSAVTLALSLWVAPKLLWASQGGLRENVKQAAFHRLMTRRYLNMPNDDLMVHADSVSVETGWLGGVVVVQHSDDLNAKVIVAASAKPDIVERGGEMVMLVQCLFPDAFQQSGETELDMQDVVRMQRGKLPNPFADRPKFYDWSMLCSARSHPMKSSVVREELEKIRRAMCIQRFYRELVDSIRATGEYDKLVETDPSEAGGVLRRVVLKARDASIREDKEVVLSSPSSQPTTTAGVAGESSSPVTVTFYRGERVKAKFLAQRVKVEADWNDAEEAIMVSVTMEDARGSGLGAGHQEYSRDEFPLPEDIVKAVEALDLEDVVANRARYDLSAPVTKAVDYLGDVAVPRLLRKVAAEMHWRIAYGVCCLLMVLIGAAMGLIFRGGQVLAAMAIAAVPASLVIVLLLMGKELISSSSGSLAGVVVVWTGVALMALVTGYIYVVPMRR